MWDCWSSTAQKNVRKPCALDALEGLGILKFIVLFLDYQNSQQDHPILRWPWTLQSAGAASVAGAAVCSAALLVSQGRKAGTSLGRMMLGHGIHP